MRIIVFAIIAVLGAVFLLCPPAYAWWPTTHLFLGREALDQASLLSPYLNALLTGHPLDFLYGSIFADMSIGKKFFMYARLAHNWRVGFALKDGAKTDEQLACAYGYLAHLAADTVSHNEYVPFKLVEHYSMLGRGHLFFEGRLDAILPDHKIHKLSKEVIAKGSEHNDEFLERSLAKTLFSFETNRRIFRGLMTINRNTGLQLYRRYRAQLRNHISHPEMEKYIARSLDAVMDFLEHTRSAQCYALDPHGKKAIKQASRLRSKLRRSKGSPKMLKEALEIVTVGPHGS